MKGKHILPIFITLLLAFLLTGCEEEDIEARIKAEAEDFVMPSSDEHGDSPTDVSKYTALLDMSEWSKQLDADSISSIVPEEAQPMVEKAIDALGYMNWEQTKLKAEMSDGRIQVTSKMKYTGDENDNSLSSYLLNWEAGHSKMPSYFQRDDLLGLVAIGNPTALLDGKMGWLINSGAFDKVIDSIPPLGEMTAMKLVWGTAKMTIKGYWYTAKYDYYDMIGDSMAIAIFENGSFEWEDCQGAETFLEASPVRFVIALELDEPGLTDALNGAVEDYLEVFEELIYPYNYHHRYDYHPSGKRSYDEDYSCFQYKTKKIFGREINYIDFEGAVQIAWMEYGGALIISDLDTIENIDDYFNPASPVDDVPYKFNEYFYIDLQKMLDNYYTPFEDVIDDELDYWREYSDDPVIGIADEVTRSLRMARLGVVEFTEVFDGEEVVSTLQVRQDAAELMLIGIQLLDVLIEFGPDSFEPSIGAFSGLNPARPPDMPELVPVEPPGNIAPRRGWE